MKQEVFNIKALPDLSFRPAKVSPVDLLSLATTMDLENFKKTKEIYSFILENTEVQINDKWFKVKVAGRDVYMPESIETNLLAMNQIIEWFFDNILKPLFQESSK